MTSTPPLHTPTPPPARRLSRPALGLGFLVVVLFVTSVALIITAPGPKISPPSAANPRDQKPAEPAFLNSPPRRREPSPQASADPQRIEELLRAAKPAEPAAPAAAISVPQDNVGAVDDVPPLGAYRPYPSYSRREPQPAPLPPSWQAAFASSLLAASASATPASAFPQPPSFTPPPALNFPAAEPPAPRSPESLSPTARRTTSPSPGKLLKPRTLPAGTVLNAILLTSLSTDLPGDAVAHLTSDVYAADGTLILPRGARLVGSYQNRVALGANRLAIAWDRLLLDGRSYEIPGLPSTTPDGAAGQPGVVNNHTGLVFGRAALLSLISAGSQLGQPRQSRVGPALATGEVAAGALSQQLSQAATEYLNRAVDVSPTLFVPAGARVTVLLPYDLELN
jgi:type IV secretion system protein TrbI